MIERVVFDLDGVILDSEQLWDEVREQLARVVNSPGFVSSARMTRFLTP